MIAKVAKRCLLALLLLGLPVRAGELQEVEAKGEAAIIQGDKAQARDKAIDDALRKAVESAVGTMISSETISENYQLLSDRIYSHSDGYVQKYRITDEREGDGVYIVEVKAKVTTGSIHNDLQSLQLLMERKDMPRVLIMVAEQNIGETKMSYWWGGQSGHVLSEDMRIVESTILNIMREKGFTFVDPETLSGTKKVSVPVALLSNKQAMRVARTSDAELLIVGKAVARDLGQTWEGTRYKTASAEVSIRAINTSNGEIIASVSVPGQAWNINATAAGSQALRNAGKAAAEKLIEQITAKWVAETSSTSRVRVTVSGVKNSRMLKKLIGVMSGQVRSVKSVHTRRMKAGVAELEIMLAGKTRDLAAELEAKDFGGVFKLEVESVRASSLGLKLLP